MKALSLNEFLSKAPVRSAYVGDTGAPSSEKFWTTLGSFLHHLIDEMNGTKASRLRPKVGQQCGFSRIFQLDFFNYSLGSQATICPE